MESFGSAAGFVGSVGISSNCLKPSQVLFVLDSCSAVLSPITVTLSLILTVLLNVSLDKLMGSFFWPNRDAFLSSFGPPSIWIESVKLFNSSSNDSTFSLLPLLVDFLSFINNSTPRPIVPVEDDKSSKSILITSSILFNIEVLILSKTHIYNSLK